MIVLFIVTYFVIGLAVGRFVHKMDYLNDGYGTPSASIGFVVVVWPMAVVGIVGAGVWYLTEKVLRLIGAVVMR